MAPHNLSVTSSPGFWDVPQRTQVVRHWKHLNLSLRSGILQLTHSLVVMLLELCAKQASALWCCGLWSLGKTEQNKTMENTFIFEETSADKCIGSIILVKSNHHLGADAERKVPTWNVRVKFPMSCHWDSWQASMAFVSKPPVTCESVYRHDCRAQK